MIIALIGPPASGKGTIGEILSRRYEIPTISTGKILRELNEEIKNLNFNFSSGQLIDDNTVNEIMLMRIQNDDCKNGFILDGYPRNLEQAKFLNSYFNQSDIGIDKIIYLDLTEEVIKQRILGRIECGNCGKVYNINNYNYCYCEKCGTKLLKRSDDNEKTLEKRLQIYNDLTSHVIEYYKKMNKVTKIDATKTIEEIIKEIN